MSRGLGDVYKRQAGRRRAYSRQKEDQVGAIAVRADLVDRGGKFLLLGVVHLS